ncbi:MAG: DNA polymerase III subunit delta [Cyclobacteriaceae bacterium]|nr:DNA polymerase III subunit delta [Cyclobacteriaceae bacterium]
MDAAAKKVMTDLRAKRYAPVYLLQGEEPYYIDLIASYIEANVLSESEKGFNQVVLYGKESPTHVILNHAKRFPMMAERQVVIVREAQEIPDLSKEAGQKLLLDYFQRPVPSTVLVLCHKYKTLDKRKELGKKAEQLTTSLTFKKLYENQLPEFVEEYVTARGFSIAEGAVRLLCESVGVDLSRMASEIDKVLIARQPGYRITEEDVLAQVGMSREFNIFELQKALVLQDQAKACLIADYFAGNTRKNPLIMTVAFLYGFYSKLYTLSYAAAKGDHNAANTLKINPYSMRDYTTALQKYSVSKLAENVSLLKETDLKLKGVNSGSTEEGQLLRELVLRLIR